MRRNRSVDNSNINVKIKNKKLPKLPKLQKNQNKNIEKTLYKIESKYKYIFRENPLSTPNTLKSYLRTKASEFSPKTMKANSLLKDDKQSIIRKPRIARVIERSYLKFIIDKQNGDVLDEKKDVIFEVERPKKLKQFEFLLGDRSPSHIKDLREYINKKFIKKIKIENFTNENYKNPK